MRFTTAIIGTVIGYTWCIVPIFGVKRWLGMVPIVLVLALSFWRALQRGEWGLNRPHFFPALGWALVFTVPVLVLTYGVGMFLGTIQGRDHPLRDFIFLFLWACGQQFALQTVILREVQTLFSDGRAIVAAASIFSFLHLPNPFLTPTTFLGALVWCWIYSRHPNLIPLSLAHAAASLMILTSLDRSLTGGMRVGYSYFLL